MTAIETRTTTKPCHGCMDPTPYEEFIVAGSDLMSLCRHLCDKCQADEEERQEEAARKERLEQRRRIWEEVVPIKYRETDTARDDFNKPLWHCVRRLPVDKSMALIGPAGRCKTRVFALMAARAVNLELTIGWCPANSFQWAAQRQFDDAEGRDAREWLRRWKSAAVLFLDDLGKHRWSDAVESEFFGLIEHRISKNLPTHWSMNPDPSDPVTEETLANDAAGILSRALDPTGAAGKRARFAPIVSRLLDNTTLIAVP